ncbi:RICIN domain-containing protein [Nonomuraea sp. ZG12]|uniref:RICIN domain-containing protein n=1 Tax=Nonomuraea sp. ZG12 TaxID=3452207 RepID=UPI003F88C88A
MHNGPSTYITNRWTGLAAYFSIRASCYIPDDKSCPNGTAVVLGKPGQGTSFYFNPVGRAGWDIRWFGNYCLDVYGYGTHNGAKVVLWQCTGHPNQLWYPQIFEEGDADAKILVNFHSGKCLDADNPSFLSDTPKPGAALQIWDCIENTGAANRLNQDWAFESG